MRKTRNQKANDEKKKKDEEQRKKSQFPTNTPSPKDILEWKKVANEIQNQMERRNTMLQEENKRLRKKIDEMKEKEKISEELKSVPIKEIDRLRSKLSSKTSKYQQVCDLYDEKLDQTQKMKKKISDYEKFLDEKESKCKSLEDQVSEGLKMEKELDKSKLDIDELEVTIERLKDEHQEIVAETIQNCESEKKVVRKQLEKMKQKNNERMNKLKKTSFNDGHVFENQPYKRFRKEKKKPSYDQPKIMERSNDFNGEEMSTQQRIGRGMEFRDPPQQQQRRYENPNHQNQRRYENRRNSTRRRLPNGKTCNRCGSWFHFVRDCPYEY